MISPVVQCDLCPKNCRISNGQSGECRIRVNLDGRLIATTYAHPCAVHVDPMEKKPMFHFLPGTKILSLATVGCNLHCMNCQNWEISQQNPENVVAEKLEPEEIAELAKRCGCRSIAYTYTEPIVYYEYTLDSCMKVSEAGLFNVLVTAGYANTEPWRRICRFVAGANIDLKSISDTFYREVCSASLLPVQRSLIAAKESELIVEVTNLIIPTLNDKDEDLQKLSQWIVENLGRDTPLHFSRFYPAYRMQHLPPTPAETLLRAREIAQSEGLLYVYVGNLAVDDGSDTVCPRCHEVLVRRKVYAVLENKIRNGRCPKCQHEIYGLWS